MHEVCGTHAEKARSEVACADELAQQAKAIEAACEAGDAAATSSIAPIPVVAGFAIKMGPEQGLVGGDIAGGVRLAEEPVKGFVVFDMRKRAQLQPVERHVSCVQIDGVDLLWVGSQIAHHITAARRDGDDAITGANFESLHVNDRVFPDLRVDHSPECKSEHAFSHALK